MPTLRLLLDEHYPHWACEALISRGVDAVSIQKDRPWLLGASDVEVLKAAAADQRIVVTEDVSTFPAAIAAVDDHCGVIYCRWNVFPRTRAGVSGLVDSLVDLTADPPSGLGTAPVIWWLQSSESGAVG